MGILHSASFWVALAFIVVVAIIVFKARGAVLGGAYARIERVASEIAHAEGLREEAQKLLVEYEKQYREALEQSRQIVEDAREETKVIVERATEQADDMLQATMMRSKGAIERAKVEATSEVREQAMQKAMLIVTNVAVKSLSNKGGDVLVAQAIEDITSMKR